MAFPFRRSGPLINLGSEQKRFDRLVGRPTTTLGQRQADESATILRAMAERETDPQVRDALMQAIEVGTFSQQSPLEAAGVNLARAESQRAEDMNLERDKAALQLLGAEYGVDNLPPELIEQFGLDTESPLGTRVDRMRTDILSRLGQQQTSTEQRETSIAEAEAARRGQQVSAQDLSAIRNRTATLAGRQRQAELGDLRRETSRNQQNALGGLVGTLTGTTSEGGNYGGVLGDIAANKPSFTRGLTGRRTSGGGGNYGVGLVGGGEQAKRVNGWLAQQRRQNKYGASGIF